MGGFDRFAARTAIHQGRNIDHVHPADHRAVLDALVIQLEAAIAVIDAVPVAALSLSLMPGIDNASTVAQLRDLLPCSACGSSDWQVHHCIDCSTSRANAQRNRDGR